MTRAKDAPALLAFADSRSNSVIDTRVDTVHSSLSDMAFIRPASFASGLVFRSFDSLPSEVRRVTRGGDPLLKVES